MSTQHSPVNHTTAAEHYTTQAVLAAAVAWKNAHTDAEVEAACDALTSAVDNYETVTTDLLFATAFNEMADAASRRFDLTVRP